MKKILLTLFAAALIFAGCAQKPAGDTDRPLRVGAILPLTGYGAIWGETIKNGIELARSDLAKQGIEFEIIYEDHQGLPATGVSAYNKLVNVDKVDVLLSTFSSVSTPLAPLANEDQVPMLMSLVATLGITEDNPYVFRLFPDANQYGEVHFDALEKKGTTRIATLYINDEYGNSVNKRVHEIAEQRGVEIVASETFPADTTDFRTQLLKIKAANPEAVLYSSIPPAALISVLKQFNELNIEADFYETGANLLTLNNIRADLGQFAEGRYTTVFPVFFKPEAQKFVTDYLERYDSEPLMSSSPYGYEMLVLLAEATGGNAMTGDQLRQAILDLGYIESVNGKTKIQANGEINSDISTAQVVNDELVLVE